VAADDFVGAVTEQRFGGGVPTRDDPVQGLARDRLVRRLHDRRQPRHGLGGTIGTDRFDDDQDGADRAVAPLDRQDVLGPAARDPGPTRRLPLNTPAKERLAGLEDAVERPFELIRERRHHLTHRATKMCLKRPAVDRRQMLIQTPIAELPIDEGEARIRCPIERLQLGQMLVRAYPWPELVRRRWIPAIVHGQAAWRRGIGHG
jgi:hypothetical protein